jgi:cold shock protein
MEKGTVKWFNSAKGYGFITDRKTGQEIFVHASQVPGGNLEEGQEVTYEIIQGKKGLQAGSVDIL